MNWDATDYGVKKLAEYFKAKGITDTQDWDFHEDNIEYFNNETGETEYLSYKKLLDFDL
jgi:hypothetical protein